jgi:CBS domain-containing protein
MIGRFETVGPTEMLEAAMQRLSGVGTTTLPVLSGSRLVGILTPDNVGEFLALSSALRPRS